MDNSGPAFQIPAKSLTQLLEQAALMKMTPEETFEQRVSWVWGQLPASDPRTKDDVRNALLAAQKEQSK